MKNWIKLVIAIVIPQLVAAGGAYFTVTGRDSWYQQLEKPEWNPPGWVFGPVWTVLYVLMGIAFYLVWTSVEAGGKKRTAMVFWGLQLFFNFFMVFFILRATINRVGISRYYAPVVTYITYHLCVCPHS